MNTTAPEVQKSARRLRLDVLPSGLPPRGLKRVEAAEYIRVSATKWDELVMDGRMPKPKRIDGCVIWDRLEVDKAFAALPDDNDRNEPWGSVAV
jgi:hypothetical protein